jgi:hypothetical protein
MHTSTSAPYGGEWSASRSGRFTTRERAPGTHWIGGWVGPRTVLDAVVKRKILSSRRESNPRTPIVQPCSPVLYWHKNLVTDLYLFLTETSQFIVKNRPINQCYIIYELNRTLLNT